MFKYTFLPRGKDKATLSNVITIIINEYLPSCKQKYLFQNYQQLSHYRAYKDTVPSYLHDRPRSVILHCLNRKAKGERIPAHYVHDVDGTVGVFEVEKESGNKKTVNFGHNFEDMPSCTCKDWQRFHLPCKHFFAIFNHRAEWKWEQLPCSYLESAYLSVDHDALTSHFTQQHPNTSISDDHESPQEAQEPPQEAQELPQEAQEPQAQPEITQDLTRQVNIDLLVALFIYMINVTGSQCFTENSR